MRTKAEVAGAIQAHANDVLRACAVYLREKADREDAFQETFLRFARSDTAFADDEHRKAWLIRVAINVCKDMLKSANARVESLDLKEEEEGFLPVGDDGQEGQRALEQEDLRAALFKLEDKYRIVLYLKYYEGYTAAQIAQATDMPENTVYTNLARGKRKLLGMMNHG
ncbi:MAG: RNA polymerase sigma factor [Atopobiaceae bacterium]|nr:RNA polymerase sigma factor [Atopobiaceae bacterium]